MYFSSNSPEHLSRKPRHCRQELRWSMIETEDLVMT